MKNQFLALTGIMAVFIFTGVLMIVYPYYQYYVDPDAVAYLTISQRYAAGDFKTAVNGYWSPWSCWLTALLIKQGVEAFKAAIVVNAIGAGGFLIASSFFFSKFIKEKFPFLLLTLTLALFLVYAVFKQSFADLWYIFFLLLALLLMIKERFLSKPFLWVAVGFLGALAYYAKAYAFPYFILSTLVLVGVLINQRSTYFNYRKWLQVSGICIGTMIVSSLPWMWALHEKYGLCMTSTSGTLNLSWYLIGHPYFKEGIDLLIPPVYVDSVYYWEDPYLVNGVTPHFWNAPKLFLMQMVRCCYTLLKLVNSMNELSAFFVVISLVCVIVVCVKRVRQKFHSGVYLLAVVFLLFPLGYLLINFESRYLWFLIPLSMVIGVAAINQTKEFISNERIHTGLIIVFSMSYLIFPIWDMKALYRAGEKEHLVGQQVRQANISGNFASNISELVAMQGVIKLAYFSGNSFYYMPWQPTSQAQLLKELKRYNVTYYFHFHEPFQGENIGFSDEEGNPFPLVFEENEVLGLKVYQLVP